MDIRMGDMMECISSPRFGKGFQKLGFSVNHISRHYLVEGAAGKILTHLDVILENDECVMAVDVQTQLRIKDVQNHMVNVKLLRLPLHSLPLPRRRFMLIAKGITT